jgi:hypothetical protein
MLSFWFGHTMCDLWTVGLLMISLTAAMVAALLIMKNLREILPSDMPSPLTPVLFESKRPDGLEQEGTGLINQTIDNKM